jgi:cation diffusion facilitator CzcD-associated flavoprotein CzcO
MGVATHEVLVIGTGFAGLGMGVHLKKAGIDDFVILEAADGVGGTWRDNHYPGAACDVPSHLYSFSFEHNPRWSRTFGLQEEILAYLEHVTDAYGLRPHIRFGARVTKAAFDERASLWTVTTADGTTRRTKALVSGCGALSRPSFPDIPGCESFQGKTFHSARWDHSLALDGKKVGVIGTGASAIQIVPAIAPKVAELQVFQRTPPWISPKPDYAIPEALKELFEIAPPFQTFARSIVYGLLEWRGRGFFGDVAFRRKNEAGLRDYLDACVKDADLREKLRPNYELGCKRILLSNDYYQALGRENVAVVTDAIDRIEAGGVRTKDGRLHELDALVLATGFQVSESCAPFEIRGTGGRELNEEWSGGAEAYLGTTVAGFPNLFLLVGPNVGLGHNSMVFMIEAQIAYVMGALHTMRRKKLASVEVRRDAQDRYNEELQAKLATTVWSTGGCKAWYTTRDGKNTTLWPGYTVDFWRRTRRFDPALYHLVPESEKVRSLARAAPSLEQPSAPAAE